MVEQANGHATQVDEVAIKQEIRTLTSDLIQRYQFARMAGLSFGDQRDMYEVLGYPRVLTNREFRDRYDRGGITGRIVDSLPKAAWRGEMEIVEDQNPHDDTEFEKAWKLIAKQLKVTSVFERVNILSRLSPYAVLLLGVTGDAPLREPLPKASGKDRIIFMSPYSGAGGPGYNRQNSTVGQANSYVSATIVSLDQNLSSPRFGLPEFYRLTNVAATDPVALQDIHWTRIIHVAENCLDSDIYGASTLERIWNLLDDLDKVTGGGAEAFWLRANQGLQLDVAKDMTMSDAELVALREQAEEYRQNIGKRLMRTRGVTVNTLGSDVANFNSPADAILTQLAGSTSIPKRILTGSEMGELASSQDRDNWKDQINGYQTQQLAPYLVRQLVDRLIEFKYLPMPKGGPEAYEVKWPHVQTLTEQEKVELAKGMAATNQTAGEVVFTVSEIREKTQAWEPLPEAPAVEAPAETEEEETEKEETEEEEPVAVAAEDRELIRVLAAAIEAGNEEVVKRIVGLDA